MFTTDRYCGYIGRALISVATLVAGLPAGCHDSGATAGGTGGAAGATVTATGGATATGGTGGNQAAGGHQGSGVGGGTAAGGSSGPGGQAGARDQGGGAGAGTTGVGGQGQSCLGACLDAFLANCPEIGETCVSATVGQTTTSCYANGVKDQTAPADAGVMGVVKDLTGKVCRTRLVSGSGEDLNGPDGTLIAHVAYGSGQDFTVTCHAADGTVQVTTGSFDSPSCAAVLQQAQQVCANGDCVW